MRVRTWQILEQLEITHAHVLAWALFPLSKTELAYVN